MDNSAPFIFSPPNWNLQVCLASCYHITETYVLGRNPTATWPHGSGRSRARNSPSRNRLKKRASERNSGIWRRRQSAGMPSDGRSPGTSATIMTEDAKTEKYTAGSPCGAYIESPCKFSGLQGVFCSIGLQYQFLFKIIVSFFKYLGVFHSKLLMETCIIKIVIHDFFEADLFT